MALPAGRPGPVEAMMAADAASRLLGIELLDHGQGWARARLTVTADMVNGHGTCHGGLIFSLADTAFACACNSWGPVSVAAGCDITFVAPARTGDILVAEARARARYGRNGIYDVTVTAAGRLIAEFRGRSHELRPQAPQLRGLRCSGDPRDHCDPEMKAVDGMILETLRRGETNRPPRT
ncbi:MAG TPA: hydroxyphenylacetyl-CoA thioesterase PaaI [Trebonia sp.]|nr:hydroxyphenylacetyl-CoA thioesterase PaaI [Trebonia sp.]